jgi:hypothetical protein
MLNLQVVFGRLKKIKAFAGLKEEDYRLAVYGQEFTPPAGGAPTAYRPRQFPTGGVILGITASAYQPDLPASSQGTKNRQLFALDFSYSGGEALVIDGPIQADALLGSGEDCVFPAKELIISPTSQISCRAANLTTSALVVNVAYHCLVFRFAG